MDKQQIITSIVDYLNEHKVKALGFFGSFARGEMTENSDIDVLVEYNRGTTLFDIVQMHLDLTEKTGRKVDLVDNSVVRPKIMEHIKKDLIPAYHG